MTPVECAILAQYHKRLKLAKIWRAIARRHLSHVGELTGEAESLFTRLTRTPQQGHPIAYVRDVYHDNDGETDP